jgi:hypothetical protein
MPPSPPPAPYDPYPYSFTDSSKPFYPLGLYGAQLFVSDVRARWVYQANVGAQYPADSFRWMSGDCDDFAIMLAYYLQEYWRYDTFVILIDIQGRGGHACAFVTQASGVASGGTCLFVPIATVNGATYYPLDWTPCTDWTWSPVGQHLVTWEWNQLAGNATLGAD